DKRVGPASAKVGLGSTCRCRKAGRGGTGKPNRLRIIDDNRRTAVGSSAPQVREIRDRYWGARRRIIYLRDKSIRSSAREGLLRSRSCGNKLIVGGSRSGYVHVAAGIDRNAVANIIANSTQVG